MVGCFPDNEHFKDEKGESKERRDLGKVNAGLLLGCTQILH